jgi:Zn-dependent alcohol dehydrogenase
MRAAVLRAPGTPLVLEDVELAGPQQREVLVRIEAAGVCHSDWHYMSGALPARLPIVVGHEGAGVVSALGPGVTGGIAVGDRVALTWRPRCGECAACIAGNPVQCELGKVLATTNGLLDGTTRLRAGAEPVHHLMGASCFAEYAVVSEASVVRVPDGVSAEIAAVSACAVITGVGAVLHGLDRPAGAALAVIGTGGVGLCAVMAAALVGAEPVIAVDVDPAKLALAKTLGATHTVDARSVDPVAAIHELTGGGAPAVVDAVGAPQTMAQAFAALRPGGTLVAVGLTDAGATFGIPVNELVQRQKRVVGALYGASNPPLDLPRIWALYLAGRLPLDALVTARRPLAEVNEAYAALRDGAPGRTVLIP